MVVLAVGMVTFFAAVSLFAGKQGKTEFSQAMHDIQTRVQSIINEVRTSTFPDATQYSCSISAGGSPTLTPVASGTGTNEDCIFLGKAVHIVPPSNPNRIGIYTVLGSRLTKTDEPPTTYNSVNATGVNPEGMIDYPELNDAYTLPFGVTVLSAREDTQPITETYMMGFYNSLQSSATTDQGSQALTTIGYLGFNSDAPGQIKNAIDGDVGTQAFSKSWTICFQSSASNEKAELVVNSSFSGVTTSVNYKECT
jgi:hypothetical protein